MKNNILIKCYKCGSNVVRKSHGNTPGNLCRTCLIKKFKNK